MKLSNLTFPKNYTVQKVGITQSLLSIFLTCRVKFLLSVNGFYVPNYSKALHFGTMGHKMLVEYYTTGKYNIKNFCSSEFRIDQTEIERQKAVLEPIMKMYCSIYKNSEFTQNEKQFQARFHGFKLLIKIDGLTSNGYLVDHKFRSKIDENAIANQLSFDFQSLFYIIVLESFFQQKFKGAYNNIIRHPQFKFNEDKESLKNFKMRLYEEIKKDPNHFFKRFQIPFTEKDKDDYKSELLYKLVDVEKLIKGELQVYKNETACKIAFPCQFLETCSRGNLDLCKKRKNIFPELDLN